jgi:glycosyltransferase involved in cell wall biosynthesis
VDNLITYVFGNGRNDKLQKKDSFASEFFYGYVELHKEFSQIKIIENNSSKPKKFTSILIFLDKVLRKLTNLPFFTSEICSYENFKKVLKTDLLIITNDRLAVSLIPLLLVGKILKTIDSCVFVMGLFGKPKIKFLGFIQRFFILLILKINNNFFFLGKGEYDHAIKNYKKYAKKFHYIPFCVDTNFWTRDLSTDIDISKYQSDVLFIGNDGNRDYKIIVEIAESMPHYQFNVLTSQMNNIKNIPSNLRLIKSNWNESLLSDTDIMKFYRNTKISIIPLIESLQPSGQSVALQSMINKVPVMITKTKGFWDKEIFHDKKNIIFVESNELKMWKASIEELIKDEKLKETVSNNAFKIVNDSLNMVTFIDKLRKFI